MKKQYGIYTWIKKAITLAVGLAVLWASIIFSKNGFEFKTASEFWWIGWTLAFAATCAEFMLNSSFKRINWMIVALGISAYIYSIYTNMLGFQSLRPTSSLWDPINIIGSIFMDAFPEVAIAWALDESKLGDLIGNLIQAAQNPEQVTNAVDNSQSFGRGRQPAAAYTKPNNRIMENIRRSNPAPNQRPPQPTHTVNANSFGYNYNPNQPLTNLNDEDDEDDDE